MTSERAQHCLALQNIALKANLGRKMVLLQAARWDPSESLNPPKLNGITRAATWPRLAELRNVEMSNLGSKLRLESLRTLQATRWDPSESQEPPKPTVSSEQRPGYDRRSYAVPNLGGRLIGGGLFGSGRK